MSKIYISAMLILICTSCATQKMAITTDEQKDSVSVVIKESVVYRDTIIYVEVPVEVDRVVLPDSDTSHLETSIAVSEAWVADGKINHTLENKRKSLSYAVSLPEYMKEIGVKHTSKELLIKEIEVEKELNSWQNFRMTLGTITMIIGTLVVLIKLLIKKSVF